MPSEVSLAGAHDDREPKLEELKQELAEAREQQAATAEILRAISSSPDLQRVFAEIAASAARLCDAYDAGIFQVEGDLLRQATHHGSISFPDTLPLTREVSPGRAVLDRRTVHIADLQAEADEFPDGSVRARHLGFRAILNVPLIRAGEATGVISIRRTEVRPFTDRQIDLVNTFADKAVIDIENSRLFEANQARTRQLTERTQELTEALEYQTATSDVLAVISRSKFDLQPTLDAIASTASRLCGAADVTIFLRDGGDLRSTAHYGHMSMAFPYVLQPIGRDWVAGRTMIDRKPIHVHDLFTAGEDLSRGREIAALAGHRTTLGIPLLREDAAIGCILLRRDVVHPFAEKQITILQTF